MKLSHQTVGNIGLYYVCYRLSLLGWNVMPTARNARGVDVVAYSDDGIRKLTFQVKALSKRNPVALGKSISTLIANYLIVCRHVRSEHPECFILDPDQVKQSAVCYGAGSKLAYLLDPVKYESVVPPNNWDLLTTTASAHIKIDQLAKVDQPKPGVIANIIGFLRAATEQEPVTKKAILAKLEERFPERPKEAMWKTINCQVPKRLRVEKGIAVNQNEQGYWADPI